jgi:hypothetical protein
LSSLSGSGSGLGSLGGLGKRQAANGLEDLAGLDLNDLSNEDVAGLDGKTAANGEAKEVKAAASSFAAALITALPTAAALSAAPLTTLATITRGSILGGS